MMAYFLSNYLDPFDWQQSMKSINIFCCLATEVIQFSSVCCPDAPAILGGIFIVHFTLQHKEDECIKFRGKRCLRSFVCILASDIW